MKTSKNKKLTAFPETLSKGTEAQEFMAVFLFLWIKYMNNFKFLKKIEKWRELGRNAASLYFQNKLFL